MLGRSRIIYYDRLFRVRCARMWNDKTVASIDFVLDARRWVCPEICCFIGIGIGIGLRVAILC